MTDAVYQSAPKNKTKRAPPTFIEQKNSSMAKVGNNKDSKLSS
jgi:hypothetical protein